MWFDIGEKLRYFYFCAFIAVSILFITIFYLLKQILYSND
jgi:hypothetical protein